jgi:hypothetical protein
MAALVKDLQAAYGIADWVSDEPLTYEALKGWMMGQGGRIELCRQV